MSSRTPWPNALYRINPGPPFLPSNDQSGLHWPVQLPLWEPALGSVVLPGRAAHCEPEPGADSCTYPRAGIPGWSTGSHDATTPRGLPAEKARCGSWSRQDGKRASLVRPYPPFQSLHGIRWPPGQYLGGGPACGKPGWRLPLATASATVGSMSGRMFLASSMGETGQEHGAEGCETGCTCEFQMLG